MILQGFRIREIRATDVSRLLLPLKNLGMKRKLNQKLIICYNCYFLAIISLVNHSHRTLATYHTIKQEKWKRTVSGNPETLVAPTVHTVPGNTNRRFWNQFGDSAATDKPSSLLSIPSTSGTQALNLANRLMAFCVGVCHVPNANSNENSHSCRLKGPTEIWRILVLQSTSEKRTEQRVTLDIMLKEERSAIILRAEFVGGWSNIWDPEDPETLLRLVSENTGAGSWKKDLSRCYHYLDGMAFLRLK
ncbi:hypothetical protein WISP_110125 [Willisornis vidua]|uniref:Uncharacterized protein n=1 Tax=Willisornis vidua TaxID=1566151 RepID=A0ABQ9D118_9PASS|nr:hypothetical protein WISP_110125 [Willisornis vidua]